jgi:hypothetical protein
MKQREANVSFNNDSFNLNAKHQGFPRHFAPVFPANDSYTIVQGMRRQRYFCSTWV